MKTFYSINSIETLIGRYIERGGQVITAIEGSLGYGTTILHGEGLKTAIIQEHYINEWSSGNTVRMYNKTPAKYQQLIEAN